MIVYDDIVTIKWSLREPIDIGSWQSDTKRHPKICRSRPKDLDSSPAALGPPFGGASPAAGRAGGIRMTRELQNDTSNS